MDRAISGQQDQQEHQQERQTQHCPTHVAIRHPSIVNYLRDLIRRYFRISCAGPHRLAIKMAPTPPFTALGHDALVHVFDHIRDWRTLHNARLVCRAFYSASFVAFGRSFGGKTFSCTFDSISNLAELANTQHVAAHFHTLNLNTATFHPNGTENFARHVYHNTIWQVPRFGDARRYVLCPITVDQKARAQSEYNKAKRRTLQAINTDVLRDKLDEAFRILPIRKLQIITDLHRYQLPLVRSHDSILSIITASAGYSLLPFRDFPSAPNNGLWRSEPIISLPHLWEFLHRDKAKSPLAVTDLRILGKFSMCDLRTLEISLQKYPRSESNCLHHLTRFELTFGANHALDPSLSCQICSTTRSLLHHTRSLSHLTLHFAPTVLCKSASELRHGSAFWDELATVAPCPPPIKRLQITNITCNGPALQRFLHAIASTLTEFRVGAIELPGDDWIALPDWMAKYLRLDLLTWIAVDMSLECPCGAHIRGDDVELEWDKAAKSVQWCPA